VPVTTTASTSDERVADIATHLRLAITRTARRLRQEAAPELSPSQGSALVTIERHGPLTPSELAERERIKRPTATRVVARLEEDGLIERTAASADARSSLLSLTPAGSALIRRLRRRKTAYLAARLRRLDTEELSTLERASELLEALLEDEPS
jgi:DNA-binding MarR family transcriptional regulator